MDMTFPAPAEPAPNGGIPQAPPTGAPLTDVRARVPPTTLALVSNWDAALTYDVLKPSLDGPAANVPQPVFVGRKELLGSLVNAISEPDRRGTYLISGYRGAGKTSLVIEAASQAVTRLNDKGLRLFPLVLNVSEISASLQPATGTETPPLGIDARRLLTALLRTLRNRLVSERSQIDPDGDISARVARAYEKSAAAQYTQKARQRAAQSSVRESTRSRSLEVANLLKLVAVVAVLAAIALEGVAIFGATATAVQIVCAALAGVAVMSFHISRTQTSRASRETDDETQYVIDNSLHQVETDLKDILDELASNKRARTMFVLEELDKVEDQDGAQLDAVIRYFKNLFTQAPALFFFLTDKGYFDVVDEKIAAARRERSYAVEHTFFTNRVFVSRPSLEECLQYFVEVLPDSRAQQAISQIRDTVGVRLRDIEEMSPDERFLRVLLFRAQNHLFDLKNEMRGYVNQAGSGLVYDEQTLPPQEQVLAGLQFAIEQKARLYRFGGGRDYANEILRNCLFGVCATLGTDVPQTPEEILPKPEELGVQLRLAERTQIAEAVDSLIGDLSRGGALEVDVSTQPTSGITSFRWRPHALSVFKPVPRLEPHEQALQDQLERAIRVCRQFAPGGPLADILEATAPEAERLVAEFASRIEEIRRASHPLSAQDAALRAGQVVQLLAPVLAGAHSAHGARLGARGWTLSPASSDGAVALVSPTTGDISGQIALVYGSDQEHLNAVRRLVGSGSGPAPTAVVIVEDDPGFSDDARTVVLETWRSAFGTPGDPPHVLVTLVGLGEGVERAAAAVAWGDLTSDELGLARTWTIQYLQLSATPPGGIDGPAWLGQSDGTETRFESLRAAVSAWLASGDPVLAAPQSAGSNLPQVIRAFVHAAPIQLRPQVLYDPSTSKVAQTGGDSERRLLDQGRLVVLDQGGPAAPVASGRRRVLGGPLDAEALATRQLEGNALDTLRASDAPEARLALADVVVGHSQAQALALYRSSAQRGDPKAMAAVLNILLRTGDPQAGDWETRLLATRDWATITTAAAEVDALDSERALRLYSAAADAGDPVSMAELLVRLAATDEERSRSYQSRLAEHKEWGHLQRAAARLHATDRERAAEINALVPPPA